MQFILYSGIDLGCFLVGSGSLIFQLNFYACVERVSAQVFSSEAEDSYSLNQSYGIS